MKNKFYAIIIGILLLISLQAKPVAGATTPTPTASNLEEQINQLQTNIASKVAEMNLVEKRGIIGTVSDVSDTQITLSDLKGNTRYVDVDELTKFSSSASTTFGISDITKGMRIGVLGIYNKQSRRILAREIDALSPFPSIIYGVASLIDNKNYEITVVDANKQKTIIEIQDVTKTYSYSSPSYTLARSGFSKIQQYQTIIAIGFPDKQAAGKILGSTIIVLPDISLQSTINVTPQLNPTIQPSTGSGVKLYPITK